MSLHFLPFPRSKNSGAWPWRKWAPPFSFTFPAKSNSGADPKSVHVSAQSAFQSKPGTEAKNGEEMMAKPLSKAFRSIKPHNPPPISKLTPSSLILPSPNHGETSNSNSNSKCRWSVYLILSTNSPIKTYVGVTTNFSRRLKQHNGELKGGAKASRAGRPWVCACTIRGFKDKSEACKLETQWKICSKKLPRKKKNKEAADDGSIRLLQHRHSALNRVKDSTDFTHLKVVWKLNPS